MDSVPESRAADLLRAWSVHGALLRRAPAAERRLGTSDPRNLDAALAGVEPDDPRQRAMLLGGIRLLPRGRYFRNGRDVYPGLLNALLAAAGVRA
jgi:hypothetical protein